MNKYLFLVIKNKPSTLNLCLILCSPPGWVITDAQPLAQKDYPLLRELDCWFISFLLWYHLFQQSTCHHWRLQFCLVGSIVFGRATFPLQRECPMEKTCIHHCKGVQVPPSSF